MRHNKSGDVFLIFDRLLKVISKSIIFEGKSNLRDASVAKTLITKHFKNNNLYEYIKAALVISEWKLNEDEAGKADLMLQEIRDYVRDNIDYDGYINEKSLFIKDVKKIFDLDMLLLERIGKYKTISSTHLFLEDCISSKSKKDVKDIENRIKIKSFLINEIIKSKEELVDRSEIREFLRSNDISSGVLKYTKNAFFDEIKDVNFEIQTLLEDYIYHTNTDIFIKSLRTKISEVCTDIKKELSKIEDDNQIRSILEVVHKLSDFEKNISYDNYVSVLHKICEAIELKNVMKED